MKNRHKLTSGVHLLVTCPGIFCLFFSPAPPCYCVETRKWYSPCAQTCLKTTKNGHKLTSGVHLKIYQPCFAQEYLLPGAFFVFFLPPPSPPCFCVKTRKCFKLSEFCEKASFSENVFVTEKVRNVFILQHTKGKGRQNQMYVWALKTWARPAGCFIALFKRFLWQTRLKFQCQKWVSSGGVPSHILPLNLMTQKESVHIDETLRLLFILAFLISSSLAEKWYQFIFCQHKLARHWQ